MKVLLRSYRHSCKGRNLAEEMIERKEHCRSVATKTIVECYAAAKCNGVQASVARGDAIKT